MRVHCVSSFDLIPAVDLARCVSILAGSRPRTRSLFLDVLHDAHPLAVDSVVFVPCFERVHSYHRSLVAIVLFQR